MCGIAGIWNLNRETLNHEKLKRFTDSLSHRGPDGFGYYIDETGNLGLGHRRLSILDLSEGGKQPMSFDNGRYWITYNGEIFNFIELRDELKNFGYSFLSDSDTEVILAAYHRWGPDCLSKFNGMWAFAIWDTVKKELFFARDRFGIKPLHILWMKDTLLAFASETTAFKNLDGYRRSVNEKHLAAVVYNSFAIEGYGETIFNDVQQLPGGHYCVFQERDQKLKFVRWWNLLDNLVEVQDGFDDQTTKFQELFFDSCGLRLRSDVPIATALSGGLDSSSVYSTIKYLSGKNVLKGRLPGDWQTAFVATFPGADNDEREFADQVIKGVNGKGIFTVPDDVNLVDHIVATTRLFDSVYLTPVSVVVDVYRAMSKYGYKVSLDGHGVDEMLFGYSHMLTAAYSALTKGNQDFLAEDVKATYRDLFPSHTTPPPIGQKAIGRPKSLRSRIKAYLPESAVGIYRAYRKQTAHQQLAFDDTVFYPGIDKLSDLDKNVFREFNLTTLPTILRNFDRASMQSGIEIRMPFMDWRLVSYVFSLPFTSKIGDGYTKHILRSAMRDIVPEQIRTRKTKIGFNAPMPMWFSNQLKAFIHDEVNSSSFSTFGLWDSKLIKSFIQDKSKNGWTWGDCNRFWPYLNAHLITKTS